MTVTYEILEEFDGTRVLEMPDPENEGQTISTTDTVRNVKVKFTQDDIVHERMVNVVFDASGNYDEDATKVVCEQVAMGVETKIKVGVIS